MAAALPMPVTDELRRGNFSHCPRASVEFSLPSLISGGGCKGIAMFPDCELLIFQEKDLPTLQQELMDTKQALASAHQDREKLLREIRKYNPLFEL